METYIKVSFWLNVIAITINALVLMSGEFPRIRKETEGFKMVQILFGSAFAVWAGFLIYA